MADVSLRDVYKSFAGHMAVNGVNLDVVRGQLISLLGPSGCGKTTCLRMIAGFITPTSGQILIGGRDVTRLPAHRRNTGMVFQSYALFPHHTVAGNVAFGLKVRRINSAEREKRTLEALRLVRLEDLADRYPSQLSGGQRQRVALARAVVINPEILLLDEPLGALDLKLREELQIEIKRVQSTLGVTTLFVTHDQGEALSMSDRVAVMREGKIVQIGTPSDIYERPSSRYVANFVGRINLIAVVVEAIESGNLYRARAASTAAGAQAASFQVSGTAANRFGVGDRCLLAVRPEHVRIDSGASENALATRINNMTYYGNVRQVDGTGATGEWITALIQPGAAMPTVGTETKMCWDSRNCFLLRPDDE